MSVEEKASEKKVEEVMEETGMKPDEVGSSAEEKAEEAVPKKAPGKSG